MVLLMSPRHGSVELGPRPQGRGPGDLLIEAVGIAKHFGGVQALKDVSVSIRSGSVHALVGENGAGKSTLGRVLAGAVRPDRGTLQIAGEAVRHHSPRDAIRAGVALIAQELELVPQLTVAQNIMLGHEPRARGLLSRSKLRKRAGEIIADAGFDLALDARVGDLKVAERQQVEILRAIARNARLIVMDEPTTALTASEVEKLGAIIRTLVRGGAAVVYVSHNLKDVLAFADTITVMRNGSVVQTTPAHGETEHSLVEAILGRATDVLFPPQERPSQDAPVVLSVRGLGHSRSHEHGISFELRRGEILGVAGLLGSGRSTLARMLFQAERPGSGEVILDGTRIGHSPREAFNAGLALLPEDRRELGLIMGRSITENLTLPHLGQLSRAGLVDRTRTAQRAKQLMTDLGITAPSPRVAVQTLSGGNQQKVLFGKCLLRHPKVLILDEPTRGVDVGAKLTIYSLIQRLAQDGAGIIVISSEIEEVLGLAHRVLVMRNGEVVANLPNDRLELSTIMQAAFGIETGRPHAQSDQNQVTA
jgi:ABC-type sugar transport system ATPase subunit